LLHELREEPEPSMEELIEHMTPVDLLLIEGFKRNSHSKLEVTRPSTTGEPMLAVKDENIVAVASDEKIDGLSIPVLDLDDVAQVADFIIRFTGAVPSCGNLQMGAAE